MSWLWIIWLSIGVLFELGMLFLMWWARDPDARTLTNVVEPWIRKNWLNRVLWWIGATVAAVHLGTGWF